MTAKLLLLAVQPMAPDVLVLSVARLLLPSWLAAAQGLLVLGWDAPLQRGPAAVLPLLPLLQAHWEPLLLLTLPTLGRPPRCVQACRQAGRVSQPLQAP